MNFDHDVLFVLLFVLNSAYLCIDCCFWVADRIRVGVLRSSCGVLEALRDRELYPQPRDKSWLSPKHWGGGGEGYSVTRRRSSIAGSGVQLNLQHTWMDTDHARLVNGDIISGGVTICAGTTHCDRDNTSQPKYF